MSRRIVKELSTLHSFDPEDEDDLPYCLEICAQETGKQFVFIIDEWDAVFRELENDIPGQKYYLDFLRNLFKDRAYLALVYMTGILPVKKYGKHSALNMFSEYSMVSPRQLAPFTGFTADEVHSLCHVFGMSYPSIKNWYDGYTVYDSGIVNKSDGASHASLHSSAKQYHLYAPLSVVNAMLFGQIQNYWNATETFEALAMYIRMVFDGLKEIVARLMDGARIPVVMDNYQNDMTTFNSKDDVLTLLIHLGYLGYDQLTGEVFIPNREILDVFKSSTRGPQWASTMRALRNSQELLEATWAGDAETVAGLLEAAHDSTGNRTYNSEAALSYAVQLAYYKAQDEYTLLPEVDTGRGYADLIYIPKNPTRPALLVELKYRQDVDSAMEQIKRQKYPARLEHYKGNLILVGISYDRDANPAAPNFKHHSCQLLRA